MGTYGIGNGRVVTCPHCGLRFREDQGDKYKVCLICRYRWRSRGEGDPKRCPSCRSSKWNVGEREAKCTQCGHEWVIRSKRDPQKCPECQSTRWKEGPFRESDAPSPEGGHREEDLRDAMRMYSKGSSCLKAAAATGVPLEVLMKEIRRTMGAPDDSGKRKTKAGERR